MRSSFYSTFFSKTKIFKNFLRKKFNVLECFFYYSELVLSLIRFWSFLESLTNWLIYYESEIWRIWRNMWIRNDVMVVYGLDYIGKWVSGSASFASFRIFYLVHRFLKICLSFLTGFYRTNLHFERWTHWKIFWVFKSFSSRWISWTDCIDNSSFYFIYRCVP